MSKLTPENEKLLRSYKNITKALGLSPNSREYFEFKKLMTEDELTVLRWLKKEVSQQNHIANRLNGTVSTTNRGRKKKDNTDAPVTLAEASPPAGTEPINVPVAEQADAPVAEQADAPVAEPIASNEQLENQLP